MKVAIFGGSFNPPHIAHVLAVTYVLATQDVDQVLVVPCYLHPLGKRLVAFEHRLAMAVAAMGWLPHTEVSALERELGGASRTLRTIEHLKRIRSSDTFHLVMGADLLLEAARWHGFEKVTELAPPIVLGRAGVQAAGAPPPVLPEVSSSAIRQALATSQSEYAQALLPRSVWDYIGRHGLYRELEPTGSQPCALKAAPEHVTPNGSIAVDVQTELDDALLKGEERQPRQATGNHSPKDSPINDTPRLDVSSPGDRDRHGCGE